MKILDTVESLIYNTNLDLNNNSNADKTQSVTAFNSQNKVAIAEKPNNDLISNVDLDQSRSESNCLSKCVTADSLPPRMPAKSLLDGMEERRGRSASLSFTKNISRSSSHHTKVLSKEDLSSLETFIQARPISSTVANRKQMGTSYLIARSRLNSQSRNDNLVHVQEQELMNTSKQSLLSASKPQANCVNYASKKNTFFDNFNSDYSNRHITPDEFNS